MKLHDMQILARAGHTQEVYALFGMAPQKPVPQQRPFARTRNDAGQDLRIERLYDDVDERNIDSGYNVPVPAKKLGRRQGIYTQSAESVVTGVRDVTRGGKNKARLRWPDPTPHFGPLVVRSAS